MSARMSASGLYMGTLGAITGVGARLSRPKTKGKGLFVIIDLSQMTSFYDYFYKKANKRLVQLFALY